MPQLNIQHAPSIQDWHFAIVQRLQTQNSTNYTTQYKYTRKLTLRQISLACQYQYSSNPVQKSMYANSTKTPSPVNCSQINLNHYLAHNIRKQPTYRASLLLSSFFFLCNGLIVVGVCLSGFYSPYWWVQPSTTNS